MNYVLDQGKKFYQISLSILISCLLDNVPYNDVVERSYKSLTSRSKRAKMFLLWKIIDSLSFLFAVKGVRGCEKKKWSLHYINKTNHKFNIFKLNKENETTMKATYHRWPSWTTLVNLWTKHIG